MGAFSIQLRISCEFSAIYMPDLQKTGQWKINLSSLRAQFVASYSVRMYKSDCNVEGTHTVYI